MNRFELFTVIYFWLDNFYKDTTDESIINQLSEMNPFLWKDICSADPAVYDEFCTFIGKRNITIDNSLELAVEYVKTIDYADMAEAFRDIDEEEWKDGCRKYLAMEHKGADIRE